MAKFNYAPLMASAKKLIEKFGYTATIRRKVDGVTTDYTVTIVMTEYKPSERDGVLILQTDRKAILSAVGLTIIPDPETDRLVEGVNVNGLQIVTVTPTAPAGVPIIYELQVRR